MPSTEFRQAKRKTQEKLDDSYSPLLDPQPALLGDGRGTVEVAGLTSHVWVRLGDEEAPAKVLNQKVPNIDELAVFVGTDAIDGQYQVLAVRSIDYLLSGQDYYRGVPGHHESHEWESYANQGGYDTVWASFEQVTTLMVRAAPTLGAFWIQLHEGPMPRQSGWEWISAANGNTVTLNLAGDVPGAGARMALIYIDSAGDLQRRLGAIVALAALDITDTPAPLAGEFPVAAVRLYQGQTALSDNFATQDITQLRYPQFGPAGDWLHDHSDNANGGPLAMGLTDTDGTAGSVLFLGAAGVLQQDNADFFWDDATDRLGLGTNAPAVRLDVDGNSNTAAVRIHGLDGPNEIADLYVGATGNLIVDLTAGSDTGQYIDLRSEDDEFGVIIRESDGTGSAIFANLYVVDAADDYVALTVNKAVDIDALTVTDSDWVGIGTLPDLKLHVKDVNAATAAPVQIARFEVESSGGAGAAGLGPAIEFTGEDAGSNLDQRIARLATVWQNAAAGTRRGQYRLYTGLGGSWYTTGVIVAPNTASTEPGAAAWGLGAVDFQTWRNNVNQVAAGSFDVISGGSRNRTINTGAYNTVCGGDDNTITGGSYGIILGGLANDVQASWGLAAGQAATVAHTGAMLFCADLAGTGFTTDYNDQVKVVTHGMFVLSGDNAIGRALFHLHQTDENEPFIHYDGSGAADCSLNISDLTPTFALVGYVRIQITDDNTVVANGDYWMPFYSCTP